MKRSLLAALCLCASCAIPGPQPLETVPAGAAPSARLETPRPAAEEPRLYARDGSVVTPRSAPREGPPPAQRELQGSEGSRFHMLELYQQVVDERDALAGEVRRLTGELDAARQRQGRGDDRLAQLEKEQAERARELELLRAQSLDLAGRLTTAQIRRLQAEKLLLETRLEDTRAQGASAALVSKPGTPER